MELITIFSYTFLLVFIGELGDKTQIATGTGALANRARTRIIFLSSALALVAVAGLTVLLAGLIPEKFIPIIEITGGLMLITYGSYLFFTANESDGDGDNSDENGWKLFLVHFSVVFVAELGDKTQIVTLAVAVENQAFLPLVFLASASALVSVTGLTVWGAAKIPTHWIKTVQRIGAFFMSLYGLYMILT